MIETAVIAVVIGVIALLGGIFWQRSRDRADGRTQQRVSDLATANSQDARAREIDDEVSGISDDDLARRHTERMRRQADK